MKLAGLWLTLQTIFIAYLIFFNTSVPTEQQSSSITNSALYNGTLTQTLNGTAVFNYLNPFSNNSVYSSQSTQWVLYEFAINPANWFSSAFLAFLLAMVATGVIVGFLFYRFDLPFLFPLFMLFIVSGAPGVISLQQMIYSTVNSLACPGYATCMPALLVSLVTVIPLGIYWVFSCIEWWTGRQTA